MTNRHGQPQLVSLRGCSDLYGFVDEQSRLGYLPGRFDSPKDAQNKLINLMKTHTVNDHLLREGQSAVELARAATNS